MEQRITKKKHCIMFICLFLLFLTVFSIPARAELKTGGIEIQLNCWEETDGETRIPYQKQPKLLPREKTSYVIAVCNRGSDAWVRLQIQFLEENGFIEDVIDETWLFGIGKDWVKRGAYWYYTKPLKKGASVDFCKGIQVPDLTEVSKNAAVQIFSHAEAIQTAHITPDFTSKNPFKGNMIEGSTSSSGDVEHIDKFQILYEHGADTIVFADELFSDITEILPGDRNQDVVTVRNDGSRRIRIRLKENGTAVSSPAMSALQLKILRKGEEIYSGSFVDQALKNGIVLGIFSGKSEEFLDFELALPIEAGNETAFQNISASLVFSAESVSDQKWEKAEDKNEISENIMYPAPDPSVKQGISGGSWKLIDEELHQWEYWFANGEKAKDGWLYLYNPYSPDEKKENWFCFHENGLMQFGWIKTENDNWYFCHEISDGNLGTLIRGWHHDQDDKRIYYLDPVTGIMQSGWRQIDGLFYYFTPLEETKRQNWFWNTGIGRWLYDFLGYRTYGSMFRGEMTPDGYFVNESGAWDENEK